MSNKYDSCHALLITAHCDDAELWAGGTIARWHDLGLKTIVAVLYHTPTRRSETLTAASILGYHALFGNNNHHYSEWVLELIAENRPEVVITHPEYDPHVEHQAVNNAVLRALTRFRERRSYPQRWYVFDTYYLSRSPNSWPLLVDIRDTWTRKQKALSQHRSQNPNDLILMARHANALLGMRGRFPYAEAFYPFDLLGRWPQLRELP